MKRAGEVTTTFRIPKKPAAAVQAVVTEQPERLPAPPRRHVPPPPVEETAYGSVRVWLGATQNDPLQTDARHPLQTGLGPKARAERWVAIREWRAREKAFRQNQLIICAVTGKAVDHDDPKKPAEAEVPKDDFSALVLGLFGMSK